MEEQLRERIGRFPTTATDKKDWPDTLVTDMASAEGLETFRETLAWVVERIRRPNPG
jgi:hypothetical protein